MRTLPLAEVLAPFPGTFLLFGWLGSSGALRFASGAIFIVLGLSSARAGAAATRAGATAARASATAARASAAAARCHSSQSTAARAAATAARAAATAAGAAAASRASTDCANNDDVRKPPIQIASCVMYTTLFILLFGFAIGSCGDRAPNAGSMGQAQPTRYKDRTRFRCSFARENFLRGKTGFKV